jgi:hypothetical protein
VCVCVCVCVRQCPINVLVVGFVAVERRCQPLVGNFVNKSEMILPAVLLYRILRPLAALAGRPTSRFHGQDCCNFTLHTLAVCTNRSHPPPAPLICLNYI